MFLVRLVVHSSDTLQLRPSQNMVGGLRGVVEPLERVRGPSTRNEGAALVLEVQQRAILRAHNLGKHGERVQSTIEYIRYFFDTI